MKIITVREYEAIAVRSEAAGEKEISVRQADQLTSLTKQYRAEVFRWVNSRQIKAQQFVGVAVAGDVLVEVLPKIGGLDENDAQVRNNLVQMLTKTRRLDIRTGEMTALKRQKNLLEVIVRLFCERLFTEVHRGLVHRYEPQEDNLFVLRGKLDTTRQAKFNAAHPERFYCLYDEFHPDNPLNRVLKATVGLLRKISRDAENQRSLAELYFVLEGVSEVHPQKLEWHRIHLDRSNKRFHTLYELARMFLQGDHQDVSQGKQDGFSLMFDMNRLFEEYIGAVAREALSGKTVITQGPQRPMLTNKNGKPSFNGKPDIAIQNGKQIECIVDTKWKELDPAKPYCGVLQADIYQMLAYANRYECKNILLLYPHHGELGKNARVQACYKIVNPDDKDGDYSIRVATICLKNISIRDSDVIDQLAGLVKTNDFTGVTRLVPLQACN